MTKLFILGSEFEKRIHPEALKVLTDWERVELAMLRADVTLDIDEDLEESEKTELQHCVNQIREGLKTCMDIGDEVTLYDVYIDDIFLTKGIISQFQRDSLLPLFSLKLLLKKACDQKLKKAREKERQEAEEAREKQRRAEEQERQQATNAQEERSKREGREKREAAYTALNPPLDEARTVLDAEEGKEFERSIYGAIDAYLAVGQDYLNDRRANDYHQWCIKIERRRGEKEQETAAERKSWEFNHSLNKEIKMLKSTLYPEEKSPEDYFEKEIVDLRYTGQSFVHLLSSDKKRDLDIEIDRIVRIKLSKLLSGDFSQFIDWKYRTYYFLLPSADYSLEGIPCLDFWFDVFAVVEIKVWLKPGQKSFDGYTFTLPQIEHKVDALARYFVALQEPEFLGYHYLVLTPSAFDGYVFWQTIPLILVTALMEGHAEFSGTTIVEASEAETTYRIDNFKEQVTIPVSFASYLKETCGIDGMETLGILSERVANIVKNNIGQLGKMGKQPLQNSQATGFTDEELISSLTALGTPVKDAKKLLKLVPRNLLLPEAIKLALQKHSEIIAQQHS